MFSATAASGPIRPAQERTMQQGALEASNVNTGEEMAEMDRRPAEVLDGSKAVQFQAQML